MSNDGGDKAEFERALQRAGEFVDTMKVSHPVMCVIFVICQCQNSCLMSMSTENVSIVQDIPTIVLRF